jgi:hypothetical protein
MAAGWGGESNPALAVCRTAFFHRSSASTSRVPTDHPLGAIHSQLDEFRKKLSPLFDDLAAKMDAPTSRPGIYSKPACSPSRLPNSYFWPQRGFAGA